MSDTPNAYKLGAVLNATGLLDVVKMTEDDKSVRLLCRVHQKKQWCTLLEYVLVRKKDWTEHVCQQYFIKGTKLVYGWNFVINAADVPKAVENACRLIRAGMTVVQQVKVGRSSGPVMSMPLVGASLRRTNRIVFDPRLPGPSKGGPSHKGAYPIGTE